jgi:hypothetical protein
MPPPAHEGGPIGFCFHPKCWAVGIFPEDLVYFIPRGGISKMPKEKRPKKCTVSNVVNIRFLF